MDNITNTNCTLPPGGVCPHCGYCPHCGRGGYSGWPGYPSWPWYPQPYTISWTSTTGPGNP